MKLVFVMDIVRCVICDNALYAQVIKIKAVMLFTLTMQI